MCLGGDAREEVRWGRSWTGHAIRQRVRCKGSGLDCTKGRGWEFHDKRQRQSLLWHRYDYLFWLHYLSTIVFAYFFLSCHSSGLIDALFMIRLFSPVIPKAGHGWDLPSSVRSGLGLGALAVSLSSPLSSSLSSSLRDSSSEQAVTVEAMLSQMEVVRPSP